jgi:hypothetical protein
MIKKFILLFTLITTSFFVQAQQELKGFYIGLDINFHYLFGGAQVDGKETVGDGNRWAIGLVGGYRWHFSNDNIFAIEAQINQPFGSFENRENPDGTVVRYKIKPQSALQFNFGRSFGEFNEQVVMGYFAFNQTRFNIDIDRPAGKFKQTDFENFGRLGLSFENVWSDGHSTRLQMGTSLDALPDTENGIDLKATQLYGF